MKKKPTREDLERRIREIEDELLRCRQAEKVLRDREKECRAVFDYSLDAVLLTVPDGVILDANPAACAMFGRTVEDIRRVGRGGLVDEADPRLHEALKERAGKGSVEAEITMLRAGGEKFPAEVKSVIFVDESGRKKTSMIIRDLTDRRRAEEALRERDVLSRKLYPHVPGMIYQFMRRPDGTYCVPFATEAMQDMFGLSPEDVREDFSAAAEVVLPEDRGKFIGSIEESARNMTIWQCEYRVQIPGGPVRWLFGHSTPEKLPDGGILWHGFNTDITDRKREEKLIVRILLELADGLISRSELDGQMEYLCRTVVQLHKCDRSSIFILDEGYYRTRYNYGNPEDVAKRFPYFKVRRNDPLIAALFNADGRFIVINDAATSPLMNQETAQRTRLRAMVVAAMEHPDGSPLGFLTAEYNEHPGEFTSIDSIIIRGIARQAETVMRIHRMSLERRQAEEALRRAEIRYRNIVESALEGIFQTTPDGRIIMANRSFALMFGYDSAEEIIASVVDIAGQLYAHPEERTQIRQLLESSDFVEGFEVQCRRKNGSLFWLSMDVRAVRDAKGRLMYYEGFGEDVTARKESVERLRKGLEATVRAIASLVEVRDPYTAGHQRRVADLSRMIAQEMRLPQDQVEGLYMAATIHDIGKISIPSEILSKPTRLTDIEFSLIKNHAQYGYNILQDIEFPWPVARMVLEHHERINGSGYPNGLMGESILLESRILAVADVVEAMASNRPYRPGLGSAAALDEIRINRGVLYDSAIVDACLRLFHEKNYQFVD
ncbi:MAG: PAS domain S-box protein [Deltaproteobacteria bacterium]|nr:PAS domain S-box protein [Deltaproteobacteria bacterium]